MSARRLLIVATLFSCSFAAACSSPTAVDDPAVSLDNGAAARTDNIPWHGKPPCDSTADPLNGGCR